MNMHLPSDLGQAYTSQSQKIRVITESWIQHNGFCPTCLYPLRPKPPNYPASDFSCENCFHTFELKSKKGLFGKKVVDGAHSAMSARIEAGTQPNLLLLSYTPTFKVQELFLVPKFFLTIEFIEKRKPLSETARRSGWIGCNLLIGSLPKESQIFYVKNGSALPPIEVKEQWAQSRFVESVSPEARGWLIAVMSYVRLLNMQRFQLSDMYRFEASLQAQFPNNRNIKPKIRQQLQVLRDKGWLQFEGGGTYELRRNAIK